MEDGIDHDVRRTPLIVMVSEESNGVLDIKLNRQLNPFDPNDINEVQFALSDLMGSPIPLNVIHHLFPELTMNKKAEPQTHNFHFRGMFPVVIVIVFLLAVTYLIYGPLSWFAMPVFVFASFILWSFVIFDINYRFQRRKTRGGEK